MITNNTHIHHFFSFPAKSDLHCKKHKPRIEYCLNLIRVDPTWWTIYWPIRPRKTNGCEQNAVFLDLRFCCFSIGQTKKGNSFDNNRLLTVKRESFMWTMRAYLDVCFFAPDLDPMKKIKHTCGPEQHVLDRAISTNCRRTVSIEVWFWYL